MAKELTDDNFESVISAGTPVVIDFWAEWCGPCKKISPIVDELATEYEGVVDIYKCNVDECSDPCDKFSIRNIPTLVFLKNGEVGQQQRHSWLKRLRNSNKKVVTKNK